MNSSRWLKVILLAVGLLSLAASCDDAPASPSTSEKTAKKERNPRWAKPLEKPGLPNLHEIEKGLYRGAQPAPEGFAQLEKMGVKTIVNLRSMHSDEDEIEEAGVAKGRFQVLDIPMFAWDAKDEQVVAFLRVATAKEKRPLFFHCQHGADRTGTMAAAYRVVVQGWSKEDALEEMVHGGYNFHGIWKNLLGYMERLDVEGIRARISVKASPALPSM